MYWTIVAKLLATRYNAIPEFNDNAKKPINNGMVRVTPKISEQKLQQVADVYAYICSHALSKKCKDNFFQAQLKKVKYFTRSVFYPDSKFEEIGIPK